MNRQCFNQFLLVKISGTNNEQAKTWLPHNELSDSTWGSRAKNFPKTANSASQLLTNDALDEAYNLFGLDEAEKVVKDKDSLKTFKLKT